MVSFSILEEEGQAKLKSIIKFLSCYTKNIICFQSFFLLSYIGHWVGAILIESFDLIGSSIIHLHSSTVENFHFPPNPNCSRWDLIEDITSDTERRILIFTNPIIQFPSPWFDYRHAKKDDRRVKSTRSEKSINILSFLMEWASSMKGKTQKTEHDVRLQWHFHLHMINKSK